VARILIITGLPASGKSTLAVAVAAKLGWPLLAKDVIKEALFAALGVGDRAWSKHLSEASYALMFERAQRLVADGQSCVLEGNFRWHERAEQFASLEAAGAEFTQIICRAPVEVLLRRFRERERHAGHVDRESAAEIEAELRADYAPLPLRGRLATLDTSAPDSVTAFLDLVDVHLT
jgi:predicted kinase